jgi:hypothetical protein
VSPGEPAESPAASPAEPGESPGTEEPEHVPGPPIPPERKVLAAGILGVAIVILFGAAAIWRRMNPA